MVTGREPILIWGAGAIGGTLGAYWARAGVPVLLVDVVADHVAACRTTGLEITGPVETFKVVVPAVTPDELKGSFRRIVLAVKAHAAEPALEQLGPHLASDGFVLSAQNGLNEIAIARRVGGMQRCTTRTFRVRRFPFFRRDVLLVRSQRKRQDDVIPFLTLHTSDLRVARAISASSHESGQVYPASAAEY